MSEVTRFDVVREQFGEAYDLEMDELIGEVGHIPVKGRRDVRRRVVSDWSFGFPWVSVVEQRGDLVISMPGRSGFVTVYAAGGPDVWADRFDGRGVLIDFEDDSTRVEEFVREWIG